MKRVIWVITLMFIICGILYFPLGGCGSQKDHDKYVVGISDDVSMTQFDSEKIFINNYSQDDLIVKMVDPWSWEEEARFSFAGTPYFTRIDNNSLLFFSPTCGQIPGKSISYLRKLDLTTGGVTGSFETRDSIKQISSLACSQDFVYAVKYEKKIGEWQICRLRRDDLTYIDGLSLPEGKEKWKVIHHSLSYDGTILYVLQSYEIPEQDKRTYKSRVQVYETSDYSLIDKFDVTGSANRVKTCSNNLICVYRYWWFANGSDERIVEFYDIENCNLVSRIEIPDSESIYWLEEDVSKNKLYFLTNVTISGFGIDPEQAKVYEIDLTDFSTVIHPVNSTLRARERGSKGFFSVNRYLLSSFAFKKDDLIRVCFTEDNFYNINHSPFWDKTTIHFSDVKLSKQD